MIKNDLEKYGNLLEAKQKDLIRVVRNRDDIAIEKTPDSFDEVQLATARELAICNLARESSVLRNVRSALGRLEDGTFGVCLRCEENISAKRLAAVPWAPYCIDCQQIADSRQNSDADEWLGDAA